MAVDRHSPETVAGEKERRRLHRGADVVRGGPGNDLLCGGRGHDLIFGGPGRDRIYGEEENGVCGAGAERCLCECHDPKRSEPRDADT